MTFDCHNMEGTEIGHLNAVHTTEELKLTGNHLRGSRPLLSFSSEFNEHPHLQLLKELLTQVIYMFKLKATCFLYTLLNCKTVVEMCSFFFPFHLLVMRGALRIQWISMLGIGFHS